MKLAMTGIAVAALLIILSAWKPASMFRYANLATYSRLIIFLSFVYIFSYFSHHLKMPGDAGLKTDADWLKADVAKDWNG